MRIWEYVILTVLAASSSLLLTRVVLLRAKQRGIVDQPNPRSSHTRPTPRGGGLGIVITASIAILILWWAGLVDRALTLAVVLGGAAPAAVGFMDDRKSLLASVRMIVHLAAAIFAVCVLGGLPPLQIGTTTVDLGLTGDMLGVLAVVWTLNLFNFMDGIDGIAASEAAFVAGGGAALAIVFNDSPGIPAVAVVIAGASLGFLYWNWAPARIFMGDVGSSYLGFVIAVLAIAAARENPIAAWTWLVLGAVFFVDTTVTLVRRFVRHERVWDAHRTHAYQWCARRWQSHSLVTIAVIVIDTLWLLPIAYLCRLAPTHAIWLSTLALTLLIGLALIAGSGRSETVAD